MAFCHLKNDSIARSKLTLILLASVLAALSLLNISVFAQPAQTPHPLKAPHQLKAPHPLQALIIESAPLGIVGDDGQPLGISVDLLSLLSRELNREIKPLIVPRAELLSRLSADLFDLVFLYERAAYEGRYDLLGQIDDISHVKVMLADTDPAIISRLGYLAQMTPPPTMMPSDQNPAFQEFQTTDEAYAALASGQIQGLVFPQSSAQVILREAPFDSGMAFTSQTLTSWPLGLYARKGALSQEESLAVQQTLEIVREEHMIDSFLERFYQQHAVTDRHNLPDTDQ